MKPAGQNKGETHHNETACEGDDEEKQFLSWRWLREMAPMRSKPTRPPSSHTSGFHGGPDDSEMYTPGRCTVVSGNLTNSAQETVLKLIWKILEDA